MHKKYENFIDSRRISAVPEKRIDFEFLIAKNMEHEKIMIPPSS
jgi:hypothetical protein